MLTKDEQFIIDVFNKERILAGLPEFKPDDRLMAVARKRLYTPEDQAHVDLEKDIEKSGFPVKEVKMRPYWDRNFSECGPVVSSSVLSDNDIVSLARDLRTTPVEQDPYHVSDFHANYTHIGVARAKNRLEIIYGFLE